MAEYMTNEMCGADDTVPSSLAPSRADTGLMVGVSTTDSFVVGRVDGAEVI